MTMMTSSEALCRPPSSPNPPQSAATPRSARSTTLLRQSSSPLKRNLSPTKSRSTPDKVPARSPRKSPSKNLQSVKSVSFTPQRTKQPPRAWERRPATPFVPRDEKQKIWKRVPLGELGVDVNRPVGVSRRQQEASKDYTRVVKKLKVGHTINQDEEGEDKENLSRVFAVDAKVLSEQGDLKRATVAKGGAYDFVTMRVEEDEIEGSPKKKLRQLGSETNMHASSLEEQQACGVESDTEQATGDDLSLCEEELEFVVYHGKEAEQDPSNAECEMQQGFSETAYVEETPREQSIDQCETAEQSEITQQVPVESLGSAATASDMQLVTTASSPPEPVTNEHGVSGPAQSDAQVEIVSQEGGCLQQDAAQNDLIDVAGEAIEDQLYLRVSSPAAGSSEQGESMGNKEASNVVSEGEHMALDEEASGDDIGSSSPPTILAENVTIDELAARNSPTPARAKAVVPAESSGRLEEQDTLGVSATHQVLPRRISDDETAFLREFMSRTEAAKAERAARDQALQHTAQDIMNPGGDEQEQPASENRDDPRQAPTLEPAAQEDTAPVSPLRRSKRAVVTSIPRPQALPNSIQLKRANGNEFIFRANQASSTANVAMTTRSNTKKNKGAALNVSARLEQFLAENAKEASDDAHQATDTIVEPTSTETTNDKASKKRKRDKKDTATKTKKVLRWNDEHLVSYREAEKNLEWDSIEDSSQGSSEEQDKENEQPDQDKHVKLRFNVASSSNSDPEALAGNSKADARGRDTETRPQQKEQKVRRVRRGIAGSVNGTPAPKTRSRKIIDEDESTIDVPAEQGVPAEVSDAATAAIKSLAEERAPEPVAPPMGALNTKKSRMPVPLSSRKGASASARVRTAASSLPTCATAATTAAGEKERNKGALKVRTALEKEKEGESGDLLGRRRLRVRA